MFYLDSLDSHVYINTYSIFYNQCTQVRDEAITAGFQLFKGKGLVPQNADSDSDDVNYAEAAGECGFVGGWVRMCACVGVCVCACMCECFCACCACACVLVCVFVCMHVCRCKCGFGCRHSSWYGHSGVSLGVGVVASLGVGEGGDEGEGVHVCMYVSLHTCAALMVGY